MVAYMPSAAMPDRASIDELADFIMNISDELFNAVIRESFAFIPERDGVEDVSKESTAPFLMRKKTDELRVAIENLTKLNLKELLVPQRQDALQEKL